MAKWPILPSATGGSWGSTLAPLPDIPEDLFWTNKNKTNYFSKWLINDDQVNIDCAFHHRCQISFVATLIST